MSVHCSSKQIQYGIRRSTLVEKRSSVCEIFAENHLRIAFHKFSISVCLCILAWASVYSSEEVYVCVSSHFSLEVSLRRVWCVSRRGVPVLIVQLHPVLLLPRHDGQLGSHGLEAVPWALVLWVWLVLMQEGNKENRCIRQNKPWLRRVWGWILVVADVAISYCFQYVQYLFKSTDIDFFLLFYVSTSALLGKSKTLRNWSRAFK